jgi:hypothetical protein
MVRKAEIVTFDSVGIAPIAENNTFLFDFIYSDTTRDTYMLDQKVVASIPHSQIILIHENEDQPI